MLALCRPAATSGSLQGDGRKGRTRCPSAKHGRRGRRGFTMPGWWSRSPSPRSWSRPGSARRRRFSSSRSQQAFGWSREAITFAIGVQLLVYGLIGPFSAGLVDRFGLRKTLLGAMALTAVSFGGTLLATSPWHLVLVWGIGTGLGTGSAALVLAAVIANRWFVARRGIAMGILTGSAATGQLIFLPLLANIIVHFGWRSRGRGDLHHRRRGGADHLLLHARPAVGYRAQALWRAGGRAGRAAAAAASIPSRPPFRLSAWPCSRGISGCCRAASSCAAPPRSASSARISSRPASTTASARRPPPTRWRRWACATSSARSRRAGSPTASTAAGCCSGITACAACRCCSCPMRSTCRHGAWASSDCSTASTGSPPCRRRYASPPTSSECSAPASSTAGSW